MSLTMKQKIFIGYIVMICFTLIVGVYAIWNLQQLKGISNDLVLHQVAITEKLSKLNDSMLGQDLYEKRYVTLKQEEAENLFWNRSRQFKTILAEISRIEPALQGSIDAVMSAHDAYDQLFSREAALVRKGDVKEASRISTSDLKDTLAKIGFAIRDIDQKIKTQQNEHISRANSLSERALLITIILSSVSLISGIFFATLLTHHLNTAIERLKEATRSIRSGDFDSLPEIHGADELADLAISFKEMSARLKELEAMNLDANPLTKLPGNLAIEKELLTRLNETRRFSFCLIDLDNFKAFSDRYGYSKGSDVLQWLGEMLSKVKKEFGSPEDFLGHIGGDDFVLMCSSDRVETLCKKIIDEFDSGISQHYDPEDVKKGFIISVDRNDKPAIFGIMTVSIAVVNTDPNLIREPKEVAQKVAELKHYAKTFAKSIYIMDRRRIS